MMNGATIQGIYNRTIHLFVDQHIVTLGYQIGRGKHHVVISEFVEFNDLDVGMPVEIVEDTIKIGEMIFKVLPSAIQTFQTYDEKFQMNAMVYETLKTLKAYMIKHHHHHVFRYEKDNPWMVYQFGEIETFLNSPDYPTARNIMGLGMGLTPLGDDILTGYILGLNTIGKTVPWLEKLTTVAWVKTSRLSAQNLEDTYQRYYPDMYKEMIEDIFINHKIEKAKKVLKLGSTSGAGILTGFMYGLM